jgi:hypothetical protein
MSKKKVKTTPTPTPTPVDAVTAIQQKFARLNAVRAQLAANKILYQEQDGLLRELLPLFVTKSESGDFTVKRSISLGAKTYRLSPSFFNEKEGRVVSKVFRTTMVETFSIEG